MEDQTQPSIQTELESAPPAQPAPISSNHQFNANGLTYEKKPKTLFWLVLLVIVICAVVALFLLTDQGRQILGLDPIGTTSSTSSVAVTTQESSTTSLEVPERNFSGQDEETILETLESDISNGTTNLDGDKDFDDFDAEAEFGL